MTAQIGNQVITLHIFPNILKSKGNQTMKFGQLIDYSMRKVFFFFKKPYTEHVGETRPRPVSEKLKLSNL